MKILYIEDDLMKHADKVTKLFSSVLTKKIIKKLKHLLLDEDADSSDIRNLINKT
jgi:thymidine phosphorylase